MYIYIYMQICVWVYTYIYISKFAIAFIYARKRGNRAIFVPRCSSSRVTR